MTRGEIIIVFFAILGATWLIGPSDYENALVTDAMRKDPPQIVIFESKQELRRLTHPIQCDMTINGKCYVRKESRK